MLGTYPEKAARLAGLMSMQKYPQSTIYHFNSWTFGYNPRFIIDLVSYEDIWMAVAAAFDCKARFASLCV
jgi:hypothetical protein